MIEKIKETIKIHLLLILILIGIPSISFWSLFFTADLPFMSYVINSMAGWLTVVFLGWVEIDKKIESRIVSIVIGAISIIIASLIVYYSFNWISQETVNITLTHTHLAEAGFSFIFGICVALSFRLIIYKKNKKDRGIEMVNLKSKLKEFIRTYGYYLAFFFIAVGIAFIILSEIARRDVFINILSEMYSNLWLTTGFGFVTIGIALISIKIAIDSDYKINNIANTNFLSVLSRFEDRRLDLQFVKNRQEVKYPNIVIWKALVDIREMEELLEFCNIKKKYQKRMINLQCHLLRIINEAFQRILMCEGVKHLLQISNIVLNLEYQSDNLRTELFNHIRELFDESEDITVDEEYISNIIPYLNDLSTESFIEMREQIKTWYYFFHNA